MILPTVLKRTIGLKVLEELYNFLLGLGITTVVDLLKYKCQYPNSIHALAMLMMILRQSLSLRIIFKWLHNNLSGPEVDKLLQLDKASLNFSFKKVSYSEMGLSAISLRISTLT